MTLYQFFETVNYVAGRFPNGSAIPPSRLNNLFPQVSAEHYADCLKRKDYDALRPFRKTKGEGNMPVVTSDGTADLPDDYYMGADGYYGLDNTRINFVGDSEWVRLIGHAIEYPTDKYPIGKIQGSEIHIRPKTVNHIKFSYLTKPGEVYMDYCLDADNPSRVIYMPIGSQVVGGKLVSGTTELEDNVTTKDGLTGTYTSQTVEIDWPDSQHWRLMYLMLQKAGINLSERDVTAYAMQKEAT